MVRVARVCVVLAVLAVLAVREVLVDPAALVVREALMAASAVRQQVTVPLDALAPKVKATRRRKKAESDPRS